MKESSFRSILRLSVTLLVITAVVAACLAGVNAITADRIAAINEEKTQKAIAQVLPDAGELTRLDRAAQWDAAVATVYSGSGGYAVEVTPVGFGGEISMMVGVGTDGKVLGISIVRHTETAGLGAIAGADNAKGEAFRGQFVRASGTLSVTKDGGSIDAISGATVTSRAVTEGVNIALQWVKNFG